ncbi:hypothetical protein [Salininema proteolyticum]|uniref:Uncharacterized protein n=1 Tax=Salininema proteolyticum TaxID=1607685 RepID=A0ABV8U4S2_9ACTN
MENTHECVLKFGDFEIQGRLKDVMYVVHEYEGNPHHTFVTVILESPPSFEEKDAIETSHDCRLEISGTPYEYFMPRSNDDEIRGRIADPEALQLYSMLLSS